MKTNFNKLGEKTQSTAGFSSKMRLSNDAAVMVFQMFTKNVYSDPIGTTVREIASNCFDAHAEYERVMKKKVDSPIIVKFGFDNLSNSHAISFIDKGIGINPDRMENIYGVYFESTKSTDEEIGGFGIGAKSPLAYTDSFFVVTVSEKKHELTYINKKLDVINNHLNKIANISKVKPDTLLAINIESIELTDDINKYLVENDIENIQSLVDKYYEFTEWKSEVESFTLPKIKYAYTIVAGESSPEIHRFSAVECDTHNGTEVIIPVKEQDKSKFSNAVFKQLFYFEDIYFEGFENWYEVENDYTIFKGKNFLYRKGNKDYSTYMHVCLGKVAYPIDFSVLGLDGYYHQIPIGLKFDIDELKPTASRESLDYKINEDEGYNPIKLITEKIEAAKKELAEMLGKQHDNVIDLKSYFESKNNAFNLVLGHKNKVLDNGEIVSEDVTLNVSSIINKKDIKFKNFPYNDLTIPSSDNLIEVFYQIKRYGKKGSTWERDYSSNVDWFDIKNQKICFTHTKGEFKRVVLKQAYLQHGDKKFYQLTPYQISSEEVMGDLRQKFGASVVNLAQSTSQQQIFNDVIDKKHANKLIIDIYNEVKNYIESNTIDYDEIVIPDNFIEMRKKKRLSAELLKTTIPVTDDRFAGRSNKRISLNALSKYKGKIFYTTIDNSSIFGDIQEAHRIAFGSDKLATLGWGKNTSVNGRGVLFLKISESNMKYLEMLENSYKIEYYFPLMFHRKMKYITKAKAAADFISNWENNVHELFKLKGFEHINSDINNNIDNIVDSVKKYRKYQNYIDINLNIFSEYINVEKIKGEMQTDEFIEYKDELNEIVELTAKHENKLRWINLPYSWNGIDPKTTGIKDLIELLNVILKS